MSMAMSFSWSMSVSCAACCLPRHQGEVPIRNSQRPLELVIKYNQNRGHQKAMRMRATAATQRFRAEASHHLPRRQTWTERSTRPVPAPRSEEHTSELQSPCNIVCRLLLEKNKSQNVYRSVEHDQKTGLTTFDQFHQHHSQMPRD